MTFPVPFVIQDSELEELYRYGYPKDILSPPYISSIPGTPNDIAACMSSFELSYTDAVIRTLQKKPLLTVVPMAATNSPFLMKVKAEVQYLKRYDGKLYVFSMRIVPRTLHEMDHAKCACEYLAAHSSCVIPFNIKPEEERMWKSLHAQGLCDKLTTNNTLDTRIR